MCYVNVFIPIYPRSLVYTEGGRQERQEMLAYKVYNYKAYKVYNLPIGWTIACL